MDVYHHYSDVQVRSPYLGPMQYESVPLARLALNWSVDETPLALRWRFPGTCVFLCFAPFACLKFGLFGLFFQPEQCFSLTTILPEQCFSANFSQSSDQRTGPM